MNKKRIIIWGGNSKPLKIETLDSHASVNAFFLTKYLSQYFEVINITDIDRAELILDYDNVHAIISTAQYGFTNRIIKKGKLDLYHQIKSHVSGQLCSIADNNDIDNYYEDLLFCVRPIKKNNSKKIIQLSKNVNFKTIRTGWCAEPEVFYPKNIKKNEFNIFIDHAPYSDNALNYIEKYYKVLSKIVQSHPKKRINIFHQNNSGIVKWDFINDQDLNKIYNRKIKIPYLEIAEIYRKIHIFCLTHKESAGLSAIEAAMSGAKLYIPTDFIGRPFIKKDLLHKGLNYKILTPITYLLYKQFNKDINEPFSRTDSSNRVKESNHTWKNAAKIIYNHIK